MKNISKYLVILFLMGAPIIGFTQEKTGFQKFLEQTFEINLSNLKQGNNNAPFLKAFDQKLVWVNAVISVNGDVTENRRTKDDLKKALEQLGRQKQLAIHWDILQYNELTARENTLFASFDVDVSLEANGKTISSGKNIVQLIAKKMDGFYAITYLSVLQISKKMYSGPCYVNINKTENNTFSTLTAYPAGTDYALYEQNMTFTETNTMNMVTLENVEQKCFWNPKNNEVALKKDGSIKIGSAKDEAGVILVILKHFGNKTCTKMIRTQKDMK